MMPANAQVTHKIPILVYTKSYFKHSFFTLFQTVDAHYIDDFSEKKYSGRIILSSYDTYVKKYRRGLYPSTASDYDSSTLKQIILRCRFLRNIDLDRAYLLAIEALHIWEAVLSTHKYRACFTQLVDDYISHSLSLVCSAHGVPHFGLMASYINGHTEICKGFTGLSTSIEFNQPDPSHVQRICSEVLTSGHVQTYGHRSLQYSRLNHILMLFKFYVKYCILRFFDYAMRRSHTFYADVQPYLPQPTKLFNFIPSSSYLSLDELNNALESNGSKYVPIFVPLGVFPEASSDYWLTDFFLSDSLDYIQSIVANYPDMVFIVKDHFHMNGVRELQTILRLANIDNVLFVDPTIPSTLILDQIRPVLFCGGGSPGMEALLRNLHVFTWCNKSPWYSRFGNHLNCHYVGQNQFPFLDHESILLYRDHSNHCKPTSSVLAMILYNMSTSLPFDYVASPKPINPRFIKNLIKAYSA